MVSNERTVGWLVSHLRVEVSQGVIRLTWTTDYQFPPLRLPGVLHAIACRENEWARHNKVSQPNFSAK
jgi:hypothetical protein